MELVTWSLTTLVAAFVGSFLAGYLKKKGENLATHEDIGKLVGQMSAVTAATKEIEAKISNDVWERQRKWDVKREALFEALKRLAGIEYALMRLLSTFAHARIAKEEKSEWVADKSGAVDGWNHALMAFKEARILALLVCDDEVKKAVEEFEKTIVTYANGTVSGEPQTKASFELIRERIDNLISLVRKEIRVD